MSELTFLKAVLRFAKALWQRERLTPTTGWSNPDPHLHADKVVECVMSWRTGHRDRDYLGHALVHLVAMMEGE